MELAILGEPEEPLHGYELRHRLSAAVGSLRSLSFGALYPALHRLKNQGLIHRVEGTRARRQVVYQLTDTGRTHLAENLPSASMDDDSLGLTIRLVSKASPATRLELLKQRRADVLRRREINREASRSEDFWVRSRAIFDTEQNDTELEWLNKRISDSEPQVREGT